MRESVDLVEQIGVERSVAAARQADIVVVVADAEAGWMPGDAEIFEQMFGGSSGGGGWGLGSDRRSDSEGSASSSGGSNGGGGGSVRRGAAPALLVLNKTDLAAAAAQQQQQQQNSNVGVWGGTEAAGVPQAVCSQFAAVVETSAATLEGIEELRQAVLTLAGAPQVCWVDCLMGVLALAGCVMGDRCGRHTPWALKSRHR